MKGFVPTPDKIVDRMVSLLFQGCHPTAKSRLLDPGCGTGAFIEGVLRWCSRNGTPIPKIEGIESHPRRAREARRKFASIRQVRIRERDFLRKRQRSQYNFIVGNPPYVPITGLSEREKRVYRESFRTAQGRFDLYILFFEQALRSIRPGGRLVFITPEKFLYVEAASVLRQMLANLQLEKVLLLDENTFGELVTYPTVSAIANAPATKPTFVTQRNGTIALVTLPRDGSSWLPHILGESGFPENTLTLGEICERISCGVATGADAVFIRPSREIGAKLANFAYHCLAGRQLTPETRVLSSDKRILSPYRPDGTLLAEHELGPLYDYLYDPARREQLLKRTCARRKPWYAFHETFVLNEVLKPKIVCKDITEQARFWIDRAGRFVPRHSVYYIVPKDAGQIYELADYLNSAAAEAWLKANCQRVVNGFLRLQSTVLKKLPVPEHFRAERTGINHPSVASPRPEQNAEAI